MLVDCACTLHNVIRQTVPHTDNILLVKNAQIISYMIFCNLKSLPLVVRVGDVVKFGIAAKSYLTDSILYVSIISPLIRR